MGEKVDLLSFGEFMLEKSQNREGPALGGDCLNALAAASYMGLSSALHTSIAKDESFAEISTVLKTLPVTVHSHPVPNKKNGKYEIFTDSKGERSFVYDRKDSAASHLPSVYVDVALNTRCLFLSGVAQALTPAWTQYVEKLLVLAQQKKLITAFDINFRSKLWSLDEASDALKLILPFIQLLFLSEDDVPVLEKAIGHKWQEALNLGPEILVFRQGAKGAGFIDKKSRKFQQTPAPKVKPVDTSGAGDVFSGVFLSQYLGGISLLESCRLATELASRHTEVQGAMPKPSLFTRA